MMKDKFLDKYKHTFYANCFCIFIVFLMILFTSLMGLKYSLDNKKAKKEIAMTSEKIENNISTYVIWMNRNSKLNDIYESLRRWLDMDAISQYWKNLGWNVSANSYDGKIKKGDKDFYLGIFSATKDGIKWNKFLTSLVDSERQSGFCRPRQILIENKNSQLEERVSDLEIRMEFVEISDKIKK